MAEGLGGAEVLSVGQAVGRAGEEPILVAGGPTHMHGLSTTRSRQMAAAAAREDGGEAVGAGASNELGLRGWLVQLPDAKGPVQPPLIRDWTARHG